MGVRFDTKAKTFYEKSTHTTTKKTGGRSGAQAPDLGPRGRYLPKVQTARVPEGKRRMPTCAQLASDHQRALTWKRTTKTHSVPRRYQAKP